jgi:hypothetical protein
MDDLAALFQISVLALKSILLKSVIHCPNFTNVAFRHSENICLLLFNEILRRINTIKITTKMSI